MVDVPEAAGGPARVYDPRAYMGNCDADPYPDPWEQRFSRPDGATATQMQVRARKKSPGMMPRPGPLGQSPLPSHHQDEMLANFDFYMSLRQQAAPDPRLPGEREAVRRRRPRDPVVQKLCGWHTRTEVARPEHAEDVQGEVYEDAEDLPSPDSIAGFDLGTNLLRRDKGWRHLVTFEQWAVKDQERQRDEAFVRSTLAAHEKRQRRERQRQCDAAFSAFLVEKKEERQRAAEKAAATAATPEEQADKAKQLKKDQAAAFREFLERHPLPDKEAPPAPVPPRSEAESQAARKAWLAKKRRDAKAAEELQRKEAAHLEALRAKAQRQKWGRHQVLGPFAQWSRETREQVFARAPSVQAKADAREVAAAVRQLVGATERAGVEPVERVQSKGVVQAGAEPKRAAGTDAEPASAEGAVTMEKGTALEPAPEGAATLEAGGALPAPES
mmetsp:Transcript_3831/g.11080  ORF Transcript_3831/g.11080 Transcript_3831/m.11080 type:complete len:444 (-) Transcript_3831:55-1386(-)